MSQLVYNHSTTSPSVANPVSSWRRLSYNYSSNPSHLSHSSDILNHSNAPHLSPRSDSISLNSDTPSLIGACPRLSETPSPSIPSPAVSPISEHNPLPALLDCTIQNHHHRHRHRRRHRQLAVSIRNKDTEIPYLSSDCQQSSYTHTGQPLTDRLPSFSSTYRLFPSPPPQPSSRQLKPLLLASKATYSLGSSRCSTPTSLIQTPSDHCPEPLIESKTDLLVVSPSQQNDDDMFRSFSSARRHKPKSSANTLSEDQGPNRLTRPVTAPPESPFIDQHGSSELSPPDPSVQRRSSVPDDVLQKSKTDQSTDPSRSSLEPANPVALHQNHSENWNSPLDADGEYVRKTYAHFSLTGVPDDGFTEGKEYTRQKSGLPVWQEAELSRPTSLSLPSTHRNGVATSLYGLHPLPNLSANNGQFATQAQLLSVQASPRSSSSASRPMKLSGSGMGFAPEDGRSSLRPDQTSGSLTPSSVRSNSIQSPDGGAVTAIATSQSTESALSGTTFLTTGEWRRRQEVAEKKREELVSKIDRYGFFFEGSSVPAHNKTVILPSKLFEARFPRKGKKNSASSADSGPVSLSKGEWGDNTKRKKSDEAIAVQQARAAADQHHRSREQNRINKWSKMLQVTDRDEGMNVMAHDFVKGMDKRLHRRIFKGVPDIWRATVWWALMLRYGETAEGIASGSKSKSGRKDQARLKATGKRRDHVRRYALHKAAPSPHDVQIDLDVPRTIIGHIMFHTRYGIGQRHLFHVLHAFSLLCADCGYCQGMGPLAATLLCYFSPEQAYSAMVMMHDWYDLHSTFSPGFPGLVEDLYVQDELVKTYMPELGAVLEEQMIITSAYATKWYITLFSNSLPFETQLRVWDAWLLEGKDVITLVAVAIIWAHRAQILAPGADFEVILGALSGYFVPDNDDALMHWIEDALQRKDIRDTIRGARLEWQKNLKSGESGSHLF